MQKVAISILFLAGCASKSSEIAPAYISPVSYQAYSCQQLGIEAQNVSQQAAIATGQQDKLHSEDVTKATVGAVLFWPVLLFNSGNGATAANLAQLRGQMNAIQQASTMKNCGMTFKP